MYHFSQISKSLKTMKNSILLMMTLFMFSCGNEKVIELPKINHSKITKITDVSAAYLFYNETQTDSVELNRKNLIVSTNWLVNVDKRLTLKQVIPHIKFLQAKKENSSHKNKNAKNYFTCNDVILKNLGFIEFTNIIYANKSEDNTTLEDSKHSISINFNLNDALSITNKNTEPFIIKTNKKNLLRDLKKVDSTGAILSLVFHKNLSFQDYISYKSLIENAEFSQATISKKEFIDN